MSFNRVQNLDFIGATLGQLQELRLRGNQIDRIRPISTVKSIEQLDVSDNLIKQEEDLQSLAQMPFLK